MFEIGRNYRFRTTDHDGDSTWHAAVTDWDAPLLKVERLGAYEIWNTHSPRFVSAEPDDEAAKAAGAARVSEIRDSFTVKFTDGSTNA